MQVKTNSINSDLQQHFYQEWDLTDTRFEWLNLLLEEFKDNFVQMYEFERPFVLSGEVDTYNPKVTDEEKDYMVSEQRLEENMKQQAQDIKLAFIKAKVLDRVPDDVRTMCENGIYSGATTHNYGRSNLVHLKKDTEICKQIQKEINTLTEGKLQAQTGAFWYPEQGFMDWHTNENNLGYRVYIVYSPEERRSFFRYRDPFTTKIVTSWDKKGWTMRSFHVGRKNHQLWHCVYSSTARLSLGFNINI